VRSIPGLRSRFATFALLLIALALPGSLEAAPPARDTPTEAASAIRVFLITMGPGDAVWERFGHNAIRIVDRDRGIDVTYNYGMFDFDEPGFIPRFLRGDMLYWMAGFDSRRTVEVYALSNRSVYAQELNLTAEQRRRLVEFLAWNEQPEHRHYRYDYYRDNCSTRVRDALDAVLDGQLRAALEGVPTGTTYRSHTRALTVDDLPVYTGLNLAMGPAIDRPLDAWEESFLPMKLREHVRTVRVRDDDGRLVPLVLSDDVLFEADRAQAPAEAPGRIPGYLAAGIGIGALFLALGRFAARGSAAGRFALAAIGGAWALLTGLLGTIITLLWAATNHYVTYGNENLFQVNPLPLALVVLIPLALLRRRATRAAVRVAAIAAAAAVVGLVLQAIPGLDQVNGEIIALWLPAHLGLAGALRWATTTEPAATRSPRSTTGSASPAPTAG
jgi:hypothetical protein